MSADAPWIVHEDSELLVVHKPCGIPTTAPGGRPCLTAWAEAHRGTQLHPTSRLDAEVTGLVTFAITKRAIQGLLAARRTGGYRRGYLALATPAIGEDEGEWTRSIAIDPRDRRLRVAVDPGARGQRVQAARTLFEVLSRRPLAHALWLRPQTGRTHQLRVHAADAGAPLLGDVRYGGPGRVAQEDGRVVRCARVMLHCAWLHLARPGVEPLELRAPAPGDLRQVWAALGGDPASLEPAADPAPQR